MICWSCEKAAGGGVFCEACGAIQPPDAGADHFAVLGSPRRFAVDRGDIERRYKELSTQLGDPGDRLQLDAYLAALRDIERRLATH